MICGMFKQYKRIPKWVGVDFRRPRIRLENERERSVTEEEHETRKYSLFEQLLTKS